VVSLCQPSFKLTQISLTAKSFICADVGGTLRGLLR
jgi:hypothetical protein